MSERHAASPIDWTIRPAVPDDLPRLRRLYSDSVRQIGAGSYSPEQIAAWAAFADDREAFAGWIAGAATFVAVDGAGAVIGFAGLDGGGRIASLYVAPDWMRRGVGSGLVGHLLVEARRRGFARVHTEASHFSMPVFRRHAFTIADEEYILFNEVEFHRFLMQRDLATAAAEAEASAPDAPPAAGRAGASP